MKEGHKAALVMMGIESILLIPLLLLNGLALSSLWFWFVSLKFGLPTINAAEGAGLLVLIGLATARHKYQTTRNLDEMIHKIAFYAVLPIWCYGLGLVAFLISAR